MANPLSKGWKYLMASFDSKIEKNADPKVQIQQAADAARAQHREISQQAAEVIGNEKQLRMRLDRLHKTRADYEDQTRTALTKADQANASGEAEKAVQFTNTAEVIASQLVNVEAEIAATTTMLEQAEKASEEARQQEQQSESRLREQLQQVEQLRAQADQAEMQDKTAQAMDDLTITRPDDIPTLDSVRQKIEKRYADALGAQELAQASGNGRIAEIAAAGNDAAAASKLAEIRASMSLNEEKQLPKGDA